MEDFDVARPPIRDIDGRQYRINPVNEKFLRSGAFNRASAEAGGGGYVEHGLYEDDDDEEDIPVEELKNGRFKLAYHVPKVFYSHIIGARGVTKKRLEADTRSQITVPQHRSSEENITITASSRSDVCSARRKIHAILLAARNKMQVTHFVSIPLTKAVHLASFLKFKEEVLADDELHVNADLFQSPDKLHITVCVFALIDDDDRSLAVELFQEVKDLIDNRLKAASLEKLQLHLKGLDIMNDDPQSVRVLYAKVEDSSGVLQALCNSILQLYAEKGLVHRNESRVKLHATVMNVSFLHRGDEPGHKNSARPLPFDCRAILAKYGEYDFGTSELSEVHLSQRFTTAADGYYEATSVVRV